MDNTTKFYMSQSIEDCKKLIENSPYDYGFFSTKDSSYYEKSICGSKHDICLYSLNSLLHHSTRASWHKLDVMPDNNSRVLLNILGHTQSVIYLYKDGIFYNTSKDEDEQIDSLLLDYVKGYYYVPLSPSDQY